MSCRNLVCLTLAVVLGGALLFTACNKDRTAPQVAIIAPANSAVLMGHITIQARASDNKDVPIVEFYVDGSSQGVDSAGNDSVYTSVWDASAQALGSQHEIVAKALDLSGNTASDTVTITIGIPTGPTNHSGNIFYPETWDPVGNPHIVTGNLTISSFVTIKPGVEVLVDSNRLVKVAAAGGLLARGTPSAPILFTAHTDAPHPAYWQGLQIGSGSNGDSVVLDHCTVEYGGRDSLHSVLELLGSPASVTNCVIRNGAGNGVTTTGDNLAEFTGNVVTANYRYAMHVDAHYLSVIDSSNDLSGNRLGVEVVNGFINHDATWYGAGAPYVIVGGLTIGNQSPVTLTIDHSATLRFRPGTGIVVGLDSAHFGGLVVKGTLTSDSSYPHPGDWNGIHFGYLSLVGSSWLDGCTLDYAGGNGVAAVVIDSVAVAVENSTIRYSSNFGIRANKAGFAAFSGNSIFANQSYPVSVDPDYVSSVGSSRLDGGLFIGDGFLTRAASWQYQGYPHVIGGVVQIGDTSRPVLHILPGDTVQFAGGAVLRVGSVAAGPGALTCSGVLFTGVNQLPGGWKGLEFQELALSDSCQVANSTVRFGGGDSLGDIVCQGCSPRLSGDTLAKSAAWGIYLIPPSTLNPDTLRADNSFVDNVAGMVGPDGP